MEDRLDLQLIQFRIMMLSPESHHRGLQLGMLRTIKAYRPQFARGEKSPPHQFNQPD